MVFVLDRHQKPLMPCSEKRARLLLERGRAVVHRRFPFTIRFKDRTVEESKFQPLRLKLDPGSKTTGMAIILDGQNGRQAIFFGQVVHKPGIKHRLKARAGVRRGHRQRHTRYRPARFNHRRRPKGWLPPSLAARVDQTIHAVNKISCRSRLGRSHQDAAGRARLCQRTLLRCSRRGSKHSRNIYQPSGLCASLVRQGAWKSPATPHRRIRFPHPLSVRKENALPVSNRRSCRSGDTPRGNTWVLGPVVPR